MLIRYVNVVAWMVNIAWIRFIHSRDYTAKNIYFALVREFVCSCRIIIRIQPLSWNNLSDSQKKDTGILGVKERKLEEFSQFYTAAVGEFQCFHCAGIPVPFTNGI